MGEYGWRFGLRFRIMITFGFTGMFGIVTLLLGATVIVGAVMFYNYRLNTHDGV